MQLHGGQVAAASAGLGHGSTFTVRLPLTDSSLEAAAAHEPRRTLERTSDVAQRILIVDDNLDAADSLRLLLQMNGYDVYTAADGEESIEKVQQYRPDIIFMDLGMPKMDGVEAAKRIRALTCGQHIPIVALTGWGQAADRLRTHEAGMTEHLVKPVAPSALYEILRTLSERHG